METNNNTSVSDSAQLSLISGSSGDAFPTDSGHLSLLSLALMGPPPPPLPKRKYTRKSKSQTAAAVVAKMDGMKSEEGSSPPLPPKRGRYKTCPLCDRTVSDMWSHSKVHTQERPHQCTICGKAFILNIHLIAHSRLHTGEKPYQCQHCDARFSQLSGKQRHEAVHENRKLYQCAICGESFRLSSERRVHSLRMHKSE